MEAISKPFNAAATVIVASVFRHRVRSSQLCLRFARHRLFAVLAEHCGKHSRCLDVIIVASGAERECNIWMLVRSTDAL